jgi:hypothetical protein
MICGIQVSPLDSNSMFVAYTDGNIYQSTDAGESWNQILGDVEKLVGLRVKAQEV